MAWYIEQECPVMLKKDEKQLKTFKEVSDYAPIAVFAPGNYIYDFFPGVKVSLFHGYPINKRGDEKDDHFAIRGWFDVYCTQGESSTIPFKALEKKLQHDPEHDLNYFKKDITDYINYEIVKRYYFQKGGLMQQLKHDEEIDEAAGIINDRARYAQLLSPAKEEATATDRAKSMENE